MSARFYFLTLNECPHGTRSISLDSEGGGIRLTAGKCCGRWNEVQKWGMDARSLRAASEEMACAAEELEREP